MPESLRAELDLESKRIPRRRKHGFCHEWPDGRSRLKGARRDAKEPLELSVSDESAAGALALDTGRESDATLRDQPSTRQFAGAPMSTLWAHPYFILNICT